MTFRSGSFAKTASLRQLLRFGVVGIVATAVYFFIAILLPPASSFVIRPSAASLVASFVSVLVSYLGHHSFTFTKIGDHSFYLPRFLVISLILSLAAALGTHVLTELLHVGYRYAAAGVAVAYPVASFILSRVVVFKDRH